VEGDNLGQSQSRKQQHVLASAENVLASIGQQLGPFAERNLRQRLRAGTFFVADIDRNLDLGNRRDRRTIDQLLQLITAVQSVRELPPVAPARPVYDRINLVLAVKNAAERFREDWEARLGYRAKQGLCKAHWTRVKALARRLAEGWNDHYDNLMPIADLHGNLLTDIFVYVQSPLHWKGGPDPSDDEKQAIFQQFTRAISDRALTVVARRLRFDRVREWQDAYNKSGWGSSFARAAIIKDEIYEKAAPIPDVAPSLDRNEFLHEVLSLVQGAAESLEIQLR
jgi:hypothetical protein